MKQQWGTRESELVEKVEYLNRELEALKDFRERQGEVEVEMERLRDANEALVAAQEQVAAELERKFIEQNTKMKKEYEQKLEELKKSCEEDIDHRLDASVKRILQQVRGEEAEGGCSRYWRWWHRVGGRVGARKG